MDKHQRETGKVESITSKLSTEKTVVASSMLLISQIIILSVVELSEIKVVPVPEIVSVVSFFAKLSKKYLLGKGFTASETSNKVDRIMSFSVFLIDY
jgi:hypothetical protein